MSHASRLTRHTKARIALACQPDHPLLARGNGRSSGARHTYSAVFPRRRSWAVVTATPGYQRADGLPRVIQPGVLFLPISRCGRIMPAVGLETGVDWPADHGTFPVIHPGVSGYLVGPAAFKAVEGSFARLLVGSIPIHSRSFPPLRSGAIAGSRISVETHRVTRRSLRPAAQSKSDRP